MSFNSSNLVPRCVFVHAIIEINVAETRSANAETEDPHGGDGDQGGAGGEAHVTDGVHHGLIWNVLHN